MHNIIHEARRMFYALIGKSDNVGSRLFNISVDEHSIAALLRLDRIHVQFLTIFPVFWAAAFVGSTMWSVIVSGFISAITIFSLYGINSAIARLVEILKHTDGEALYCKRISLLYGEQLTCKTSAVQSTILLVLLCGIVAFTLSLIPTQRLFYITCMSIILFLLLPVMSQFNALTREIIAACVTNMGVPIVWFSIASNSKIAAILVYISAVLWMFVRNILQGYPAWREDALYALRAKFLEFKIHDITWCFHSTTCLFLILTGVLLYASLMFYIILTCAAYMLLLQAEHMSSKRKRYMIDICFGILITIAALVGRL